MQGDPRGRVGRRAGPAGQAQPARRTAVRAERCSMRLVFAGTPEVAVPVAATPCSPPGTRWSPCVTRPDAPAGRGRRLAPLAGRARWADERRHRGAHARPGRATRSSWTGCAELAPDCVPGGRVRRAGAAAPRWTSRAHGWVNLHFSLLPAWRGAAPVQHAILPATRSPAPATFLLEEGLDTGPVLRRGDRADPARATPPATCSSGSPIAGAGLLVRHPRRHRATARSWPCRSRPTASSLAPKITVEDARVDWAAPAFARRPAGPGLHARAGRLDRRSRGERLKLGPVAPVPDGADARRRASCRRGRSARCWSAPATAAGASWARCAPPGKRPMPAADWARGVARRPGERLGDASGADRRAGAAAGASSGRRRAAAAAAPGRPARAADPARRAAFDLLRAVDERDAYANLTLPGAAARARADRPGRGVRHRARPTARCAAAGTYDAILGRLRRPAAGPVDPPVLRRAAARRLPAARAPGSRRTPRSARPSSWPARSSARRGRLRQRGAAQGRPAATWTPGWPRSRRRRRPTRSGTSRSRTRTRVDRRRVRATRSAATWTETAAAAGRGQRAARRCTWSPGPAGSTAAELVDAGRRRARRRGRRTRCVLPGGDPGALAAVRDGPGRRAGRGQPAGRARAGRRAAGRRRTRRWLDLCAGPGGKAALLGARWPRRARRRAAGRGRVGRRTAPGWSRAARGRRRRPTGRSPSTARDAGLAPTAAFDRVLRRRAVHRPGRAAPPAGGALAPAAGGRRRRWPRCSASCSRGARRRPARRRGRLRHLLAAPGRDPRRGGRRAAPAAPTSSCVDARPLLPGVPDLGDGPDVQLWPHRHGTDAMFLALLRRAADARRARA